MELLIVIVVIGILAAIVIVAFNGVQDRAKFTQKRSDLQAINKALKLYHAEKGSYPISPSPTNSGTAPGTWTYQRAATSDNNFIPGLVPEYISKLPSVTDGPTGSGTNNTYIYLSNGTTYQLLRLYQVGSPPAIPAKEYDLVPDSLRIVGNPDRWGYRS